MFFSLSLFRFLLFFLVSLRLYILFSFNFILACSLLPSSQRCRFRQLPVVFRSIVNYIVATIDFSKTRVTKKKIDKKEESEIERERARDGNRSRRICISSYS